MQPAAIECPSCKQGIAVEAFLSACSHYWWSVNVVRFTCPACDEKTDARIESGRISIGYIYAAGSPHFCGMVEVSVDGLATWEDGEDLAAELGPGTWRI